MQERKKKYNINLSFDGNEREGNSMRGERSIDGVRICV